MAVEAPGVAELFPCDYVGMDVELTDERERHINERHPDLLPSHRPELAATLSRPDEVRRSSRKATSRSFVRWFESATGGKYVVVVVVSEAIPERHWIVTAYLARKVPSGVVEWQRS